MEVRLGFFGLGVEGGSMEADAVVPLVMGSGSAFCGLLLRGLAGAVLFMSEVVDVVREALLVMRVELILSDRDLNVCNRRRGAGSMQLVYAIAEIDCNELEVYIIHQSRLAGCSFGIAI